MRRSMFAVLICTLFGFSVNAQSHTTLKAVPSAQNEQVQEDKGIAKIKIVINLEEKEFRLPEYVKEGLSYKAGMDYMKELMDELKEKGAKITKYDYDWVSYKELKKEKR